MVKPATSVASTTMDVERYLARIGLTETPAVNLESLERLQRAHLGAVPFENLDVCAHLGVRTDLGWSIPKIVEQGRGGWCFEVNGAFGALLDALGFEVHLLGAAALLDGPNDLIDHLTLEVVLDQPYLVDVGFGDSFFRPLPLNRPGPHDGGSGTFEFIASPKGSTLAEHRDGVPEARYRFKRVWHRLEDFDAASDHLQHTPGLHWSTKPFATLLLDGGPDRVTLLSNRLKLRRNGETTLVPVRPHEWTEVLRQWFLIDFQLCFGL